MGIEVFRSFALSILSIGFALCVVVLFRFGPRSDLSYGNPSHSIPPNAMARS
jgi:hypothetical protein